jgi:hypothetical protein
MERNPDEALGVEASATGRLGIGPGTAKTLEDYSEVMGEPDEQVVEGSSADDDGEMKTTGVEEALSRL